MSRLYSGRLLAISILFVILSGCASINSSSPTATYQSQGVVQWKDGQARMPSQLIAQIERTFERLQIQSGTQSQFIIDGTQELNAYAALTDQGTVIILNAGMIDLIGWNLDEIAFVLGHEIAHVKLGHLSQSQRETMRQRAQLSNVLGVIAGALIPYGGLVVDAGHQVVKSSFSREQERNADQLGMGLMHRAGFDTNAAIGFHQRLLSASGRSLLPFLSSHPSGEERISRLKQFQQQLPRIAK